MKPRFSMVYRTVTIIHLSSERSSVAADLIASAPVALAAGGWESDPDVPTKMRRVLSRSPSVAPNIINWFDGAPPRGEFDLWDGNSGALVVRDMGPPSSILYRVENDENNHGVGFVCVRPREPEMNAARLLAANGLAPGWVFLVLTDPGESVADARSAYEAIGPVAPGRFHFRPNRSGSEPMGAAYQTWFAGMSDWWRQKHSIIAISDEAIAEGRALWTWLAPRLHVVPKG